MNSTMRKLPSYICLIKTHPVQLCNLVSLRCPHEETLNPWLSKMCSVLPFPAEPGYALPFQTVQIQISWLLKKPTDLDLHCLPLSM